MYEQAGEIMNAVQEWTGKYQAHLHLYDEKSEQQTYQEDLSNMAGYQQRNWLLAYSVYRYLQERDGLRPLTSQVLRETQAVRIPARMDTRQIKGKTLVMDGAHNAQKMTAFIGSFQRLYPGVKPAVLLSLKNDKEYESLVPLLKPFAGRIITTVFNGAQDLQARSMDPETLAQTFRAAGMANVKAITSQHQAFKALLATPEQTCVITGSFYLIGQIRNNENLA